MGRWAFFNWAGVAGLVVLIASALGLGAAIDFFDFYLQKLPIEAPDGLKFHTLPREVAGWKQVGEDKVMSKDGAAELGTDNYISRVYAQTDVDPKDAKVIELHCAYYTGMIDTVPHVPERCMVGGGWEISGSSVQARVPLTFEGEDGFDRISVDREASDDERTVYQMRSPVTFGPVRLPVGIDDLRMNVTKFRDGGSDRTLFAGYFFLANGGVVSKADDVRLLAFGLTEHYAYYAKVQISTSSVETAEELGELTGDFLDSMLPEIMRRVPDWVEVRAGRYPEGNTSSGDGGGG